MKRNEFRVLSQQKRQSRRLQSVFGCFPCRALPLSHLETSLHLQKILKRWCRLTQSTVHGGAICCTVLNLAHWHEPENACFSSNRSSTNPDHLPSPIRSGFGVGSPAPRLTLMVFPSAVLLVPAGPAACCASAGSHKVPELVWRNPTRCRQRVPRRSRRKGRVSRLSGRCPTSHLEQLPLRQVTCNIRALCIWPAPDVHAVPPDTHLTGSLLAIHLHSRTGHLTACIGLRSLRILRRLVFGR